MNRRHFLLKSILSLGGIVLLRKAFSAITSNANNMNKKVAKKFDLKFKQAFPGLKGVDIMAHSYPIEPFLVFTEFLMDKPVFGPHPHAGISVMTYMLPDSNESFINRDSQGDFSFIEPGGLHIMQAGSGMHHDEFPKVPGVETHGFQIWINHADKNRFVTPKSMHASAQDVPEKITEDYRIRIVHGEYEGITPKYKMVTDVNLFHVFLNPNKSITLDAMPMAFVYGLKGSGNSEGEAIQAQTLANYTLQGEKVVINSLNDGLEFMFATGTPHNEPITYGGPFVMTTPEQMAETRRRYSNGELGTLEPYKG
ncbi:MAG TPA: pirin family protein [Saprospiraceae bacterium]|nr:pirin family protein [Saprospiraceae bacterium]